MRKKIHLILFFFACFFVKSIQAQVVYKDVASIFNDRCTSCHHGGSIYPPLTSYYYVSGYKGLISANLTSGKMPPWPPDTTYSRFAHERIITLSEKTKILDWITAGAPKGDTTLAPLAPHYPATQLAGTPSLILTIPSFTSNATGSDKYVCFSIPTGLSVDRILRAYEIVPNDPSMVHHAVINVDTTGTVPSDLSGSCYVQGGQFNIADYAPGSKPTVFPGVAAAKFGIRLKAGSSLVVQMHYPAGSAGKVDNTQIRMYFYPTSESGIRPIHVGTPIQSWTFSIPANTTKTVTASYPAASGYTSNISVYSIFPHSHKICTSIENYASNGITTIPMCKINKWNFDWQGFYTYPKLLKIPSGYKIYGKHVFDNTTANPFNPSPVTVNAGFNTYDEMVFDGLMWLDYMPGDELIDIAAILKEDSLFKFPPSYLSVNEIQKSNESISAYPNPFSDKINIRFNIESTQYTRLSILNTLNQEVALISSGMEVPGSYTYEWDGKSSGGKHVAPGIYFYKLELDSKVYSGKIIMKPKN